MYNQKQINSLIIKLIIIYNYHLLLKTYLIKLTYLIMKRIIGCNVKNPSKMHLAVHSTCYVYQPTYRSNWKFKFVDVRNWFRPVTLYSTSFIKFSKSRPGALKLVRTHIFNICIVALVSALLVNVNRWYRRVDLFIANRLMNSIVCQGGRLGYWIFWKYLCMLLWNVKGNKQQKTKEEMKRFLYRLKNCILICYIELKRVAKFVRLFPKLTFKIGRSISVQYSYRINSP